MNLELFLKILISKLEANKIIYCILRNYETLPLELKQGDIDFLISEKDICKIQELINSIENIHVIGTTKRKYVHNYFIYNIDKGSRSKALQVDFIFRYVYKGVSYLDTSNILNNAFVMKNKSFYIPFKFDQVFLMFFPYYLSTGGINKKYEDIIIATFQKQKIELDFALQKLKLETEFIDSFYYGIINRDYNLLKQYHKKIKYKLFLQHLNLLDLGSYFISEIKLRAPFSNCFYIKVRLNPKLKNEILKSIDSFAKNIIFIDVNNKIEYLKIFKSQPNFTMYVFYKKDFSISSNPTINVIEQFILLKKRS